MRSPKKKKSTRRPCPLDIDCELVAAERGKVCPNRDYCEHVAAPWLLPYNLGGLRDGTRCLTVNIGLPGYCEEGSQKSEQIKAGWASGCLIPFYHFKMPGFLDPILVVYRNTHYTSEWGAAKDLGTKYQMWRAVKLGMSYSDFYTKDFSDEAYFDCWQYECIQEPQSEYPHCILPPDF